MGYSCVCRCWYYGFHMQITGTEYYYSKICRFSEYFQITHSHLNAETQQCWQKLNVSDTLLKFWTVMNTKITDYNKIISGFSFIMHLQHISFSMMPIFCLQPCKLNGKTLKEFYTKVPSKISSQNTTLQHYM